MQHTLRIQIRAEDGGDTMFDDAVRLVIDGATGMLRGEDEALLLEKEQITLETTSQTERDYLVDTLTEWKVKIQEDDEADGNESTTENSYDLDGVVAIAKKLIPDLLKKFDKSTDPKERRFIKRTELMARAFLEMVDGKDRLDTLLGSVDIGITVELIDSREELVVVPVARFNPEMLTPEKKTRKRKSPK